MTQNLKIPVSCKCGDIVWVSKGDAGSKLICSGCSATLSIPPLSMLREVEAVDVSPLGILLEKIRYADPPFDGMCQTCSVARADLVLPVRIDCDFSNRSIPVNSVVELQTFQIPCYLCQSCSRALNRSMWIGFAQQIITTLFQSFWLLIIFLIALFITAHLPFVSMGAAAFFVWGLHHQLRSKSGNPALLKHLRRVCDVDTILKTAKSFKLTPLVRFPLTAKVFLK